MSGSDAVDPKATDLAHYLGCARAHGEVADSKQWIADLEDMLRVAWEVMEEPQRAAFRDHPDILALAEAAGESVPLS